MAEHGSTVRHGPALPIDVVQLVMDAFYDGSSPEDHCYRNQQTYRSWSLVCHAWRIYAQSLLFRIVELNDPAALRRFATQLDSAPRLAHYVRSLRVYSRHLFTHDNVFSVLPEEIKDRLPNLRSLSVTRISGEDVWHPLSPSPLAQPELAYIPLQEDFHTRLAPLRHLTTFKLYFVKIPCFCVLVQIVRALPNLRELAIFEVHWLRRDLPAFMQQGATAEEREGFLPHIEDLTLSWLDPHGPEHIMASIAPSGRSSLKHLYIDCPTFSFADSDSDTDEPEIEPPDVDLSRYPALRDLWLSVPLPVYPPSIMAESFASLLASWAPTSVTGCRTLTISPTFETDFTRAQFVDVLRVFGPIAEAALLDHSSSLRNEEVDVCVCVIDGAEKHAWWADTVARECFPRMHARGQVRAAFRKRYWDDSVWADDKPPTTMIMSANIDTNGAVHPPAPADDPFDILGALNVLEETEDEVDAPSDDPALQLVQQDAAPGEMQTPPTGLADRADVDSSSSLRPPRRSFKKIPQLVLAKLTKVARALVRRNG